MNPNQKESNEKLQQEKTDLISQLAHEIKNPLSTIKINLSLIAEDLEKLKDSGHSSSHSANTLENHNLNRALRKITVVRKEADRLEQILDGFLRYSNKIELQAAVIDINDLIRDLIDFYMPQACSRSIIIRQLLYSKPLFCKIDSDMLKQALLNLFINAQQAMDKGGELMIKTEKEEEHAVIRINDTGEGIAEDKLFKVFDVYYSSRPQGKGLGLPLAKKIIEAHSGTINLESVLGKGTAFTIKLPLQSPV